MTPPFGIANYRSFDSTGIFLPKVSKVNVFIGKNNSGKSNILRFLRDLSHHIANYRNTESSQPMSRLLKPENRHFDREGNPIVILTPSQEMLHVNISHLSRNDNQLRVMEEEIASSKLRCQASARGLGVDLPYPINPGSLLAKIKFSQGQDSEHYRAQRIVSLKEHFKEHVKERELISSIGPLFDRFFYIPQFREFRYGGSPAESTETDELSVLGYDLSKRLALMKSPSVTKNHQKVKFAEIVEGIRELLDLPDLEIDFHNEGSGSSDKFRTILEVEGLRRNLEDYGTGIHQLVILCFALSLRENTNVGIEEPELFLHPGLQRKFYQFLLKTSNTYFITTHSNVFLDAINTDETQVYHVKRKDRRSTVELIETTTDTYTVLDDMQYHASDIMQANGIIWVEGPTDRLYLLKWLSFVAPEFKEGVEFSIMFYGGSNIKSLSLDPEADTDRFISLIRMNRNAVLILDSDRSGKHNKPTPAKMALYRRLSSEVKSRGMLWRTQGREIENYVSKGNLNRFALDKWGRSYSLTYDSYQQLDGMIKHGKTKSSKFNYSNNKVGYTKEILSLMNEDDYEVLDLKTKLRELRALLIKWNPSKA